MLMNFNAAFEAHLKSKAPQASLKWFYGIGGVRVYREPYVQFLWETWKIAVDTAQKEMSRHLGTPGGLS